MIAYIIRRIVYAIPVIIGVNIITFALFFMVNTPSDIARIQLGTKRVTPAAIQAWKANHGYDRPYFYNADDAGVKRFTDTLFFQKSVKVMVFDFGKSDAGRSIDSDISQRMGPSLALAIPTLIVGMAVNITIALLLVFFRATAIDWGGVALAVVLMSISPLFYIIIGQYFFGKLMNLVPISGFSGGWDMAKFLVLPALIGVVAGIGYGSRWYRTIFLEEYGKDYVRTARAKGLSDIRILFRHVLKNGMLPILTGVVVQLPLLFMGALIMESFFGIPGLGSYTINAIQNQDFAIVRAMVFLGSVLYIVGLLLTDISYTLFDPRIRL